MVPAPAEPAACGLSAKSTREAAESQTPRPRCLRVRRARQSWSLNWSPETPAVSLTSICVYSLLPARTFRLKSLRCFKWNLCIETCVHTCTHTQTLTCAEAAQAGKQLEDKRRSTSWGLWPTGTCSRVTPSAYGKPFSLPLHVTHRGLPTHSSAPPPGLPAAEPGVQAALAPGGCLHPLAAVCGFGFVLALFLQNHRRGHTGGGGSEADLPND